MKKKQTQKSKSKFSRTQIVIAIVAALVLLSTGYLYFRSQQEAEQIRQSKINAEQNLEDINGWFTPPGELVYNEISDNGCGRDTTSWLGIYKRCGYTLIKPYKGSGSAEANIRTANRLILEHGWGAAKPEDIQERVDYAAAHRETTSVGYLYSDATKPRINLTFFPLDDVRFKDQTAEKYLYTDFGLKDTGITLTGDEYLYGVRVVANYREQQ